MKTELEFIKIGKREGEENNFHAPELCVVNIKLFVKEEVTHEFEVETTGISDFRLINAQKYSLGNIEILIEWLDMGYKFVKEKF